MIAMQYRVALPADYDMGIIRRRVSERGSATDAFAGLGLKAYLVGDTARTGQANAYAPFYLWRTSEGMAEFLLGDGFAGLSASFGRPSVSHWLGVAYAPGPDVERAPASATIERELVAPGVDLRELRASEVLRAVAAAGGRAVHGCAVGVDTAAWALVRLTLWSDDVAEHLDAAERYEVLHLSRPELPALIADGA